MSRNCSAVDQRTDRMRDVVISVTNGIAQNIWLLTAEWCSAATVTHTAHRSASAHMSNP
jgi:hypothetical protein